MEKGARRWFRGWGGGERVVRTAEVEAGRLVLVRIGLNRYVPVYGPARGSALVRTGLYWAAQELPRVERLLDEAPRPPRWLRRVADRRRHPPGDQQRYWFIPVYTGRHWEEAQGCRFEASGRGQSRSVAWNGSYWSVLVYTGNAPPPRRAVLLRAVLGDGGEERRGLPQVRHALRLRRGRGRGFFPEGRGWAWPILMRGGRVLR